MNTLQIWTRTLFISLLKQRWRTTSNFEGALNLLRLFPSRPPVKSCEGNCEICGLQKKKPFLLPKISARVSNRPGGKFQSKWRQLALLICQMKEGKNPQCLQVCYSRVHKSPPPFFSKILEKPSIVQKKIGYRLIVFRKQFFFNLYKNSTY